MVLITSNFNGWIWLSGVPGSRDLNNVIRALSISLCIHNLSFAFLWWFNSHIYSGSIAEMSTINFSIMSIMKGTLLALPGSHVHPWICYCLAENDLLVLTILTLYPICGREGWNIKFTSPPTLHAIMVGRHSKGKWRHHNPNIWYTGKSNWCLVQKLSKVYVPQQGL